jgi:hypothetical protein
MKKLSIFLILAVIMIIGINARATNIASYSDIEIIFVSKAYWDGSSKSCLDREKGCCLHISFRIPILDNMIVGDLTQDDELGVKFTFSKTRDIKSETLKGLTSSGKFYMEGEGTLSEDVLKALKLPRNYTIRPGYYEYKESGDMITVFFK